MNCYWQEALGTTLCGPWVNGTPAPLPCFITSTLHFQVLDTTMSNHGWVALRPEDIIRSCTRVRDRAEANAASQEAERQKQVSLTSPCATFSWFHLGMVLSLVVGFLGTNSKRFVSTSRGETKYLDRD